MAMIESVHEADMRHRCHQLVDVNTLRESDSPHAISVHSIAENVTNKHQIIKVVPKNKICPKQSHLSYLIRALRTTTPVPRCVGQIYQCITPLEMSSSGQGRGWLNFCAKMASRSVRSPLKQTVLLVVLLIPLQGRSAAK